MSNCSHCFYYDTDVWKEPCSTCKRVGGGKIDKFKSTSHSNDPCKGCFYDYRNYKGADKDKAMMCSSCHRHSTRVNYTTEAVPYSCEDCKHKLEDIYTSCTVCDRCDCYSNYEADLPKKEPKPKKDERIFIDDIEQEEIKSVSDELVRAVSDFTFAFNPCKICRYNSEDSEHCQRCCYNYASEFTLRGAK